MTVEDKVCCDRRARRLYAADSLSTQSGVTALHLAAERGNVRCAGLLLNARAEANQRAKVRLPVAWRAPQSLTPAQDGETALCSASRHGHYWVSVALLNARADPNIASGPVRDGMCVVCAPLAFVSLPLCLFSHSLSFSPTISLCLSLSSTLLLALPLLFLLSSHRTLIFTHALSACSSMCAFRFSLHLCAAAAAAFVQCNALRDADAHDAVAHGAPAGCARRSQHY